jgi:hypothetical protein
MAADCHRVTLRHDPALSHQATRNRSPALPNATPAPEGKARTSGPRCDVPRSATARRLAVHLVIYPEEAQGEIAERSRDARPGTDGGKDIAQCQTEVRHTLSSCGNDLAGHLTETSGQPEFGRVR